MSQAYQQLQLDEEFKLYVVINMSRDLFRFNCLPYGVSWNISANNGNLLQGIPNMVVYIGDILVRAKAFGSRGEGVGTNGEGKIDSIEFLEHKIDAQGLHPLEEKIKAVQEAPHPRNV